jgi:cell division protein FtsI (penicillin-binding protein 3)
VGFAPTDAPRFVMLVMLDEPKNEKWGSEAAAPIFSAIGRDVLRYLDVPPRDVKAVQIEATLGDRSPMSGQGGISSAAVAAEPADGVARMPSLRGKTKRQVLALLAPLRIDVSMAGRGVVVDQDIAPGAAVERGSTIRLTLASPTVRSVTAAAPPPPVAITRTAAPVADHRTDVTSSAGVVRATEEPASE